MSLSSLSYAQSAFPFVDPEFKVPETLVTDRFSLRMLTVSDVVKDYDAVMSSKQHQLRCGFFALTQKFKNCLAKSSFP